MKKVVISIYLCVFVTSAGAQQAESPLEKYRTFLEEGTYQGFDWSTIHPIPQSRYYTFHLVFQSIRQRHNPVVVELGTSRSFVHGGLIGCNSDNSSFWTPDKPENWDWGAGFFTRMAAECLEVCHAHIHTVDIEPLHIKRCQHMTQDYAHMISYHISSSFDFLRQCPRLFPEGIDLIYLDTGDMTPIDYTAQMQLKEVQLIIELNLLKPDGFILIDDVRNQTPKKFGEPSNLGKAKYSIPFLLAHGFQIIADEYQVILHKQSS